MARIINDISIKATQDGRVEIADHDLLMQAEFIREGNDLYLHGSGGESVMIEDYFAATPPPILTSPEGGVIEFETIMNFISANDAPPVLESLDDIDLSILDVPVSGDNLLNLLIENGDTFDFSEETVFGDLDLSLQDVMDVMSDDGLTRDFAADAHIGHDTTTVTLTSNGDTVALIIEPSDIYPLLSLM